MNRLRNIDPHLNLVNNAYSCEYYSVDEYVGICRDYNTGFSLMNYNIRSFLANFNKFEALTSNLNFHHDFLFFSETWNNSDKLDLVNISGYNGFHTCRVGRGGGVSVYCCEKYKARKIDDYCFCNDTIEICTIESIFKNRKFFLIGIYRPNLGSVDNFVSLLDQILNTLSKINSTIVIAGDMNINLSESSSSVANYLSMMNNYLLTSVIDKPTWFSPRNTTLIQPSTLDHIFLSNFHSYRSGIISADFTDHCPCFLFFYLEGESFSNTKQKFQFRPYSDENYCKLENEILAIDWQTKFEETNVNKLCEDFMSTLDGCYCRSFPIKTKFISEKRMDKSWVTPEVKSLIKQKSNQFRLFKMGIISRTSNNRERNRINSLIDNAKTKYYNDLLKSSRGNCKKYWSTVNALLGKNRVKNPISEIKFNDQTYNNPAEISECLNQYFVNVAIRLDQDLPIPQLPTHMQFMGQPRNNSMHLFPVRPEEIQSLVNSLKLVKSNVNTMPVTIFKKVSHLFNAPLCRLINVCFTNGIFPDVLKIARITPIFKKGDKSDPTNYRPISSLPYLSKLFERAIYNRIISFTTKYSIISKYQFGFQKNKTTSDALVELTENIYKSLNENLNHFCVSLDLKKAFDTVNYGILFEKLNFYGIRGNVLKLLKNYFSNRKQYVQVDGESSSYLNISVGVPQGSVIGPLAFLLYVNDLPNICYSTKSLLFADDTMLSYSQPKNTEISRNFYDDLLLVTNWMKANRLTINFTKTHLINFYLGPDSLSLDGINICNEYLERKDFCDYLGVRIDKKLSFRPHVELLLNKLTRSTGIFYRIRKFLPLEARIDYYYSFIFPFLSYCVVVWGGTFDSHLNSVIVQQKKFLRLIADAPFNSHTTPLFLRFKILKFIDIYKFNLAVFIYKSGNQFMCTHNLNTRNRNQAVPFFHRLTLTQHAVTFKGPHIWNELPLSIRNSDSLPIFKKLLKAHLLSQYTE